MRRKRKASLVFYVDIAVNVVGLVAYRYAIHANARCINTIIIRHTALW